MAVIEPVRIATIDDVEVLVTLRRGLMTHFGWDAEGDTAWIDVLRDRLQSGIAEGSVIGAVATNGPRPIAGGIAELVPRLPSPAVPAGRIAHISSMYTDPDRRGRGLGRAVVRLLVAEARARGVTTIELYAASDGAESLYRSEGFEDRPGGIPLRHSRR